LQGAVAGAVVHHDHFHFVGEVRVKMAEGLLEIGSTVMGRDDDGKAHLCVR
jgi:hypothetical protein